MSAKHLSEVELIAYLEGDGGRAAAAHVAQCAACSQTLHSLHTAVEHAALVRPLPPPADLRSRLAAKLALEPVRALRCREARRMIQELLDGQASPFAAGALQLHLDACSACRVEYVTLQETTRALRTLPALAAPEAVRRTVVATARPKPAPATWPRRWQPAFAVAVAAGVALLVVARFAPKPSLSPIAPPAPVVAQQQPVKPLEVADAKPAPAPATASSAEEDTVVNLMQGARPAFALPVRAARAADGDRGRGAAHAREVHPAGQG